MMTVVPTATTRSRTNPVTLPSPSPLSLARHTNSPPTAVPPHTLHKSVKSHFPTPSPSTTPSTSPRTLADLQRAILSARRNLVRVKPTTHPTSPSHQTHNSGCVIIDTSYLRSITHNRQTVTAQAGVRLPSLPLPLVPPDKSVGSALADGALARGGFAEGLVADCLLAITLVDSRGRLRMYRRDDPSSLFRTLLVSHGLAGVIFDATFAACYTERVVAVAIRPCRMSMVSGEGLRSVVDGCTAVELSWVPYNSYNGGAWDPADDGLVVKAVKSTMGELSPGRGVRYVTIPEYMTRNCAPLAAAGYAGFEGWHTRVILSRGYRVEEQSFVTTLREAVGVEYDARGVCEESVCFGVRLEAADDWERVVTAWRFVLGLVKEFERRGMYPLNVAMKLRFVGGSEGLMAVNEGGAGCVLTVVSAVGTCGWTEFAKAVVEEWVRTGGRWVVNRDGVGVVDGRVTGLKRVVRNAGWDDYGMFEDFVVGVREVHVPESRQSVGHVSKVEEEVVGQTRPRGELWWVWSYLAAYAALWVWFFGKEAVDVIWG